MNSKDVRKTSSVGPPMARLFSRRSDITSDELLDSLETIHHDTLRKARVKAVCVANLLWRQWLDSKIEQGCEVDFYIHCDSSSQWRGLELFCATIDIVCGDVYYRRQLPLCEQLGKDAVCKVLTLLWLLFLMFGPDVRRLLYVCNHVVAIITDMGTERLMYGIASVFEEFYMLLGHPPIPRPQDYTFERAIHQAGWRHTWDTVLYRCLVSLRCFRLGF